MVTFRIRRRRRIRLVCKRRLPVWLHCLLWMCRRLSQTHIWIPAPVWYRPVSGSVPESGCWWVLQPVSQMEIRLGYWSERGLVSSIALVVIRRKVSGLFQAGRCNRDGSVVPFAALYCMSCYSKFLIKCLYRDFKLHSGFGFTV